MTSTLHQIQRALVSVADKTGIVPFAGALAARGIALISTGGTAPFAVPQRRDLSSTFDIRAPCSVSSRFRGQTPFHIR